MSHTKQISTKNPGLQMILVDQSSSMDDSYGASKKADAAAEAVNRVIYEIIQASVKGEQVSDRCVVGIIGYGDGVYPLASGWISALTPLETKKQKRQVSDGAGGLVEVDFDMPIWVLARAANGTPMAEAFEKAYEIIAEWSRKYQNSFPPVVINITDGEPNDMNRARTAANQLRTLGTLDGNLLFFNAHISNKSANEIKLPHDPTMLHDQYARFLFEISSELPETLMQAARNVGFSPQPSARGCVFNASPETLIKLLAFGSSMMR